MTRRGSGVQFPHGPPQDPGQRHDCLSDHGPRRLAACPIAGDVGRVDEPDVGGDDFNTLVLLADDENGDFGVGHEMVSD